MAAPIISSIEPSGGIIGENDTITIVGQHFGLLGMPEVKLFGDNVTSCRAIEHNDDGGGPNGTILCELGDTVPGLHSIVVQVGDQQDVSPFSAQKVKTSPEPCRTPTPLMLKSGNPKAPLSFCYFMVVNALSAS